MSNGVIFVGTLPLIGGDRRDDESVHRTAGIFSNVHTPVPAAADRSERIPSHFFIDCAGQPAPTSSARDIILETREVLECLAVETERPSTKVAVISPMELRRPDGSSGFGERLRYFRGVSSDPDSALAQTSERAFLPFDMIQIAMPDQNSLVRADPRQVCDILLRQLGHAFVAAKDEGVSTVVVSLLDSLAHGRTPFGPGRPLANYSPETIAYAIVKAARLHGSGTRILVPTHGDTLDGLIEKQASGSPLTLPFRT